MTVPAEIEAPPELFSALVRLGLPFQPSDDPGVAPLLIITPASQGFHISGNAYVSPFAVKGQDAAVGSVIAGLIGCKGLAVDEDTLCIHGAAVNIKNRTAVILAPFGAGKSSLSACLARLGATILTDDAFLLNVARRSVRGMRLPLRLRQSFIEAASPQLKDWIRPRVLFSGLRFSYLFPDDRPGTEYPLTDIILLSRGSAAEANGSFLEAASPGLILPRLLWHNLSRHHPPSRISALALDAAQAVRPSVLHYSDPETAAEFLFRGELEVQAPTQTKIEAEQRDSYHITRTDHGAVISCDDTGKILEINESALVILKLLEEFPDNEQAWMALCTIYDDVPKKDLAKHFTQSLRVFAENGIIGLSRLHGAAPNSD